ncbi:MAG TPA: aminoglycoside phosphotransferase family protein [Rhizobiaceae bacterium]|nr:aminoglycoside phosphotransferase family protein [Rhizobiaceae bacterium]
MVATLDLNDYRAAIIGSFPELSDSSFTPLTMGWHCIALDVDNRLIFKFPRNDAAREALEREAAILATVRPAVTMPVPDITLHGGHGGSPLFSRHRKLRGEHLVTEQYRRLPEEAKDRLAARMAQFYAELHRLDEATMMGAGAGPILPWLSPDEILAKTLPLLDDGLRAYAERTIAAWRDLAPDPHGTTYGFFDGHGWNMAFDHDRNTLNGVYDFADSGFGTLHQEFIYSNLISTDLTERIVAGYEGRTGRRLDRRRIEILTGAHRLSELAELADDPGHRPAMIKHVAEWAGM